MVEEVCLGKVGAVSAQGDLALRPQQPGLAKRWNVPRGGYGAWSIRETSLRRHGNDRLLLGLKGSLNSMNSISCASVRCQPDTKARRGELVVAAPVGFVKAGDPLREGS